MKADQSFVHILHCATVQADLFMAVNASTVELVDLENYVRDTVGGKPIVLWNLELDTLRADLGAPPGSPQCKIGHRRDCICRPWWDTGCIQFAH